MIRKLLLPALFVGLLGGCVTGYGYRDGYYYGQPSVEYRYYDYGYPGYYPGYGYGYGYYPYGERYRYYNSPYYGRYPYYYNPYYQRPRPPATGTPSPQPGTDRDGNRIPWRDIVRSRRAGDGTAQRAQGTMIQQPQVREMPRREARAEGSRMEQAMRRTQERRRSSDAQEP